MLVIYCPLRHFVLAGSEVLVIQLTSRAGQVSKFRDREDHLIYLEDGTFINLELDVMQEEKMIEGGK